MQSLTDLCLNKIEPSGADTRELSASVLPERMWTRHPVLRIVGTYYFCTENLATGDRGVEGDLNVEIEVVYTGVYTLKCHIYVGGDGRNKLSDEEQKAAYGWLEMAGPLKFEKTFESLEGELTPEQVHFLKNGGFIHEDTPITTRIIAPNDVERVLSERLALAQKNIVTVEIGRLLTKVGRAFFVEMFVKGAVEISLGDWDAEDFDLWQYLQPKISQALLLITAHVSI